MLVHCGTQLLESERLIPRTFYHTDDEDMLTYWISDPKIQSLYSEPTYTTKEEVKDLLDKYISSYDEKRYKPVHTVGAASSGSDYQ
jgi:ribosomal-protein-alanine N-acetyltransferase